ncbi:GntR family transcriptional regulator [Mycobacterium sp. PS03-16]|uniref:GntR family transcriptional regulator n=1 Tax=Mycobacterium sp. PS03-16 TaxID=2559611 RepID=UPI0010735DBB|nr:GntR family transcriptional regulator [Mycobacterium sp. PS03-16]TFV56419.1 GntR family transcriptional regulator [Mycobacterium sp. PS03-16]
MPKHYGVKEKDQVVAHVIGLVLTGKLRTGDRIDRNEIAAALGISRVPVQEAMVDLEYIGIVSTRYHRGAFVERFDEAALREHHELYGTLTGMAAARAAAAPTPGLLTDLDAAVHTMRAARDVKGFREACWTFRNAVNDGHAGPRLHAAIRASETVVASDFWLTQPRLKAQFGPSYPQELAAIRDGDPAAARAACLARSELMATLMVGELTRRGVLGSLRSP